MNELLAQLRNFLNAAEQNAEGDQRKYLLHYHEVKMIIDEIDALRAVAGTARQWSDTVIGQTSFANIKNKAKNHLAEFRPDQGVVIVQK